MFVESACLPTMVQFDSLRRFLQVLLQAATMPFLKAGDYHSDAAFMAAVCAVFLTRTLPLSLSPSLQANFQPMFPL